MDGTKPKLVVLLCMHRSGSSLTANALEKLGMSLGPFDLIGAEPTNPYGHFESIPFHSLNRKIQQWAFGFADDVPSDPGVLARFRDSQAEWPAGRPIPFEWLAEGERIVRTLIESGPVSGFKDPRTVLVWPFWQRVFEAIEDVDVVPAMLLRSPHEIAMSLCSRSKGVMPYWDALDVVGVHLARMQAVAAESGDAAIVVRFGTPHYQDDLKTLAEACGLSWDGEKVDAVYDPSCVHHLPAAAPHPAQDVLRSMGGDAGIDLEPRANGERLARDARRYESVMHRQLLDAQMQLGRTMVALTQQEGQLAEAGRIAHELQARAVRAERQAADVEKAFDLTRHCLEQTEKHLSQSSHLLVTTEERRAQAEQILMHRENVLAHTQNALVELQNHLGRAQQDLHATQFEKTRVEVELATSKARSDSLEVALERSMEASNQREAQLRDSHEAHADDRKRLDEAQERVARMLELSTQKDEQLRQSFDREEARWQEILDLRQRLERIESNALFGAALKGRRRIKQIWLKFRHVGPAGEQRTTRIDRPM